MTATFLVCEDGHEYVQRFQRLLGDEFRFVRAGDLNELRQLLTDDVRGLLLDLDFRRVAAEQLVDEQGRTASARPEDERRRLAAIQGILVLRALRGEGVTVPSVLFADIDDPSQASYLASTLAPLQILRSSVGLNDVRLVLRRLA